jgi:glycosyltransferase involved in cell wall biosynthesis
MLAALYTDSCRYSVAGRGASLLRRLFPWIPAEVKRLHERLIPEIPKAKIFTTDRATLAQLSGCKSASLAPTFINWGTQGADVVYSMYGEDLDFLQYAKSRGLKVVADIFTHPLTNRTWREEAERFPEAGYRFHPEVEARQNRHSLRLFELADILLCPSSWVANGCREMAPEYTNKIQICSYGNSIQLDSAPVSRVPGRMLFVGRDALGKGLHYLAQASSIVRRTLPETEFRIAGLRARDCSWVPQGQNLNFVGAVPMALMNKEFLSASVFVLPSLTEGQAGVILEAMAHGCPVIATRESGVDLSPDAGLIVPARDPQALAEAIIDVLANPELHARLCAGALRQAKNYSLEAWKQRLINVVLECKKL